MKGRKKNNSKTLHIVLNYLIENKLKVCICNQIIYAIYISWKLLVPQISSLIVEVFFDTKVVLVLIVKGLRPKRYLDLNHCVASSHKLDICRQKIWETYQLK